ncbi:MAG: hypothetical protein V1876_00255 [Candidatus Peregrinibacteria bacterium]
MTTILEELDKTIAIVAPGTPPIDSQSFRDVAGAGQEFARLREALSQVKRSTDVNRVRSDVAGALRQLLEESAGSYWLLREHPILGQYANTRVCNEDTLQKRAQYLFGPKHESEPADSDLVASQIADAVQGEKTVSGFAPFRVPGYREDCETLREALRRGDSREARIILGTMGGSFTEWTEGIVSASRGIVPHQFMKHPLGQGYCSDRRDFWNNMVPGEVSDWIRGSLEPAVVLMGTAYPIRCGEKPGQTYVTHLAGKLKGDRDQIGPSSQVEAQGWKPPAGFPTLEESFQEDCINARDLQQHVRAVVIGRNDSQAVHMAALAEIRRLGFPLEKTGGGIQGSGFNTSQFIELPDGPMGVVLESGHAEGEHWGYDVPGFHAGLVAANRADRDAEVCLAGKVMRQTILADIGTIDPELARSLSTLGSGKLAQLCFDCVLGTANATFSTLDARQQLILRTSAERIVDRSVQGTVTMLSAVQKASGMEAIFFDGSRICSPHQLRYRHLVNKGIEEQTGVKQFARVAESQVSHMGYRDKLSRTTEGAFWQAYVAALKA